MLNLYPEAGEAGGCLVVPRRSDPVPREPDPERAATEAARRARSKIRRYCAANRLNRFITLTYAGAGCHDPRAFRQDIASFFKELRLRGDVGQMPYLWTHEWHPGGHGLHGHAAVGRFIHRRKVESAWGHGFIKVKLIGNLEFPRFGGQGLITQPRWLVSL
jgi:hypothetical protein